LGPPGSSKRPPPNPVLAAKERIVTNPRKPSCVIVVENLPVPFDRRVWQEAQALRDAGWKVSVICPATERYPLHFEVIDGIAVYRHPLPLEARGAMAYLAEYSSALFHEARLLFKVWREQGFDVIQACNPPDLIFLVAAPWKLFGKRFVFDHHDVSPELFSTKFGRAGLMRWVLTFLERLTFKSANFVISTNETFRQIAIERGGVHPDRVVTVYSVPDKSRMRRVDPDPSLKRGRKLAVGYVGIIGNQDGVDHLVRAVSSLVKGGQTDFQTVIVGDGPELPEIRRLAEELGVGDHVTFTGYLSGEDLLRTLSTFDIGVIPDPMNEYNDKISMNKVFEYTTLGLPIVSYPLTETKRLLGDAASFASTATPEGLAEGIGRLLSDDALRADLAARAKQRAEQKFRWEVEAEKYVAVFDGLAPKSLAPKREGAALARQAD
jgi:glycosyltransferase involved in cell wall biosynthesis